MNAYTYKINEFQNGDVMVSFMVNGHIIKQETITDAENRGIDVVAFAFGRIDDYKWSDE